VAEALWSFDTAGAEVAGAVVVAGAALLALAFMSVLLVDEGVVLAAALWSVLAGAAGAAWFDAIEVLLLLVAGVVAVELAALWSAGVVLLVAGAAEALALWSVGVVLPLAGAVEALALWSGVVCVELAVELVQVSAIFWMLSTL